VLLAAAGVALLAGGVALGAYLWKSPPPARPVVRFALPLGRAQRLPLVYGNSNTPVALSPDGTRIAYVAFDSGSSLPSLYVRALDQFASTKIPATEAAIDPFFSPDGVWVGFIDRQERTIRKVAATGGPVSTVVKDVGVGVGEPTWADDHSIIYTDRNGIIRVVHDAGGEPARPVDSTVIALAPVVLPGSRTVLRSVCADTGVVGANSLCDFSIDALDRVTGKSTALVQAARRAWYLPDGYLVYGTGEGALFAVRFDPKSLTVTSAPVAVLDGVDVGPNGLAHVSISASGTMAYVPNTISAMSVVVQVDRNGREATIVDKPGSYGLPRLSPDGRRLALTMPDAAGRNQIWIHDRASETTSQLTFDGSSSRASWSPDGGQLAFSTMRNREVSIWRAPADGSTPGESAIGDEVITGAAAVSWTRDGKWIVWDGQLKATRSAGGDDIFAVPADTPSPTLRPVVATAFTEQAGEVSPDGKWIAYVASDGSRIQVYVQPFLAPGGRTLISDGASAEPAWASNSELVYVDAEADKVMLARLEFGPTIKVTRTVLFDHRPYQMGSSAWRDFDVTRDGKSFVFIKPIDQNVTVQPIVVLNWVEEVKRLMAAAGMR